MPSLSDIIPAPPAPLHTLTRRDIAVLRTWQRIRCRRLPPSSTGPCLLRRRTLFAQATTPVVHRSAPEGQESRPRAASQTARRPASRGRSLRMSAWTKSRELDGGKPAAHRSGRCAKFFGARQCGIPRLLRSPAPPLSIARECCADLHCEDENIIPFRCGALAVLRLALVAAALSRRWHAALHALHAGQADTMCSPAPGPYG